VSSEWQVIVSLNPYLPRLLSPFTSLCASKAKSKDDRTGHGWRPWNFKQETPKNKIEVTVMDGSQL